MFALLTDYGESHCGCLVGMDVKTYCSAACANGVYHCEFIQHRSLIYENAEILPKGKQYNITNEAIIGACFLPAGLGNIGEEAYHRFCP